MDVLPAGFAAADYTARMWNGASAIIMWAVLYFAILRIANFLTAKTTREGSLTCLMDRVLAGDLGPAVYLGLRNAGIAVGSGLVVFGVWTV